MGTTPEVTRVSSAGSSNKKIKKTSGSDIPFEHGLQARKHFIKHNTKFNQNRRSHFSEIRQFITLAYVVELNSSRRSASLEILVKHPSRSSDITVTVT